MFRCLRISAMAAACLAMALSLPVAAAPLAWSSPVEVLTGEYLPLLLQTAGAISADWAACQAAPQVTVPQPTAPRSAPQSLAMP